MSLENFKTLAMETKIIKTVKEWLPWCIQADDDTSEYCLLKNLAIYCCEEFKKGNSENACRVLKVINILYINGNLHDRNAIENEFLEVMSLDEDPSSLKGCVKKFPKMLKSAYLKTILEN